MGTVVERPAGGTGSTRRDGAHERVIVVLGYHELGDDGRHGISSICRAAVRRAEQLAAEAPPRAYGWRRLVVRAQKSMAVARISGWIRLPAQTSSKNAR